MDAEMVATDAKTNGVDITSSTNALEVQFAKDTHRHPSATSGPVIRSSRKKHGGKSKNTKQSELGSEKGSDSDTRSETSKDRKEKNKKELVLTEVDIDGSDLETVLGEDLEFQQAVFKDVDSMSRHIYVQKCEQLGVIPISMVLRRISATELNLKNHQCGPAAARAIAVPLVYNKSITTLDLSSNCIEDAGMRPICDCLIDNVAVKDLRLAENKITSEGLKHIGRLVVNNKNITSLDISGNHLGDTTAPILEIIIKESRTLKSLDLSGNDLGINAGKCLGRAVAYNECIENLNLSWNHIRLEGAVALTEGLKENVALHKLDLSWNGFGQETAEGLSKLISENEGLRELNLEGNRLNDEAMVIIAKGIRRNEVLERLALSKNLITNVGVFALLVGLKQNNNSVLQHIDVKDTTLQDDTLALLYEVKEKHDFELRHNISSLSPHIFDPMEVLQSYIMDKGIDGESLFDLVAVDSCERPQHAETKHFISKLKHLGVPLTHSQMVQLANSLMDAEVGMVDVSHILDAAYELQAETASAATSNTWDDKSSIVDEGSVVASSTIRDNSSLSTVKREREPIQAGQQYSW